MTAMPARRVQPGTQEQRRSARDLVDYATSLQTAMGLTPMRIINISPFGLMARCDALVCRGERVRIALPHIGAVDADVRWAGDGRIGMELVEPVGEADYPALLASLPQRDNGW